MELIDKINYELSKVPNVKCLDPRQLPCMYCTQDILARNEILQVMCQLKDNCNFAKDLVATYHNLLHSDINTAEQILYYKDIKTVMGIKILASKVKGRDGDGEDNLIYKICNEIVKKRNTLAVAVLVQPPWVKENDDQEEEEDDSQNVQEHHIKEEKMETTKM